MTKANLIGWMGYWNRASKGPNLHKVDSFEDMVICRRYNPCMQGGLMWDVTDREMWEALLEYRGENLKMAA